MLPPVPRQPGCARQARRGATVRSEFASDWTHGWNEAIDRKAGYFIEQSAVPTRLEDVILQGPHLTVANPYAQQPNPTMRSNRTTRRGTWRR